MNGNGMRVRLGTLTGTPLADGGAEADNGLFWTEGSVPHGLTGLWYGRELPNKTVEKIRLWPPDGAERIVGLRLRFDESDDYETWKVAMTALGGYGGTMTIGSRVWYRSRNQFTLDDSCVYFYNNSGPMANKIQRGDRAVFDISYLGYSGQGYMGSGYSATWQLFGNYTVVAKGTLSVAAGWTDEKQCAVSVTKDGVSVAEVRGQSRYHKGKKGFLKRKKGYWEYWEQAQQINLTRGVYSLNFYGGGAGARYALKINGADMKLDARAIEVYTKAIQH